jgi:hypothetical protein
MMMKRSGSKRSVFTYTNERYSEVVPGLDKASYHGDVWESGGIAHHIHLSTYQMQISG